MKAMFTPGPWEREGARVFCRSLQTENAAARRVNFRVAYAKDGDERTVLANAHLIAAAPELYEALQLACEYLECIPESAAGGDDDAGVIARKARAALAKARGELS